MTELLAESLWTIGPCCATAGALTIIKVAADRLTQSFLAIFIVRIPRV